MEKVDLLGRGNKLWREFLPAGRGVVRGRARVRLNRTNSDVHVHECTGGGGRPPARWGGGRGQGGGRPRGGGGDGAVLWAPGPLLGARRRAHRNKDKQPPPL